MRSASRTTGGATARSTVRTGQTSRHPVPRESAGTGSSSARTITAPLSLQSATAATTVGTGVMRRTVTISVPSMNLSARSQAAASLEHGSVMGTGTAWMGRTRQRIFATRGPVMLRRSSSVGMASASPNCGTVTTTTIVGMTQTSQRTSVGTATVQLDGAGVPAQPTTGVFPSGCSVTGRTTVGTALMRWPTTAPAVRTRATSPAETSDVCPSAGSVTLRMIAVTTVTRATRCALVATGSAQSQSSSAPMINASQDVGGATMMMTAAMDQTKQAARNTPAPQKGSSASPDTASRRN